LLGSFLYYFGGYKLPFFFFSVVILVCLHFIRGLEINEIEETEEEEEHSFFTFILNYVRKTFLKKNKN
jgi:hypothetical protein